MNGFTEVSSLELEQIEGGGIVAAVYALGFVMGMTPAGALVTCALGAAALGAGIYIGLTH
ncbi:MAG TPA: hypothetical protein PLW34_06170 [Termitinemataceae bacterium]|nr:hypothetical protein [Eubacteriaceae bacterium]HOJ99127.1 hypothetical protein [Termitinemataceae bacterium]HOM23127.1 hypothetical protein [Termitinemataceae bacterium]HPQ00349.1 hypothetical protein [Termitinemataceae bacterium]